MDLSILIRGSLNGTVRPGEFVVVRRGKLNFKLRRGNPIEKEEAKVFKLPSPEALSLLGDELEGTEVFVRVKATGTAREGSFAFIIPPDEENDLEIHRGETEEKTRKKAQGSKRVFNGALFKAIDEETLAEIIEGSQISQTAGSH